MSVVNRKTLVAAIAAWLTIPYALAWIPSSNAAANLSISRYWAYVIVLGIVFYCSLRILAALKAVRRLSFYNLLFVIFDLLVITFVIAITGGQNSVFFNLYWATAVSATIYFGLAGAVVSPMAVMILYPLGSFIANRLFLTNFNLAEALYRMYPFALISVMLGFLVNEERRLRLEKEEVQELLLEADQEREQLKENIDRTKLTSREKEVLALVVEGFTYKQIAENLVVTVDTVKRHIGNIYIKLGVDSRTKAAVLAEREGLLTK